MKRLYYIMPAWVCLFAMACKKETALLYSDIARVQFGPDPANYYLASQVYKDTLKNHTFAYLGTDILVDTIYFDLYTAGLPSQKDRSFVLQQEEVPGAVNAVSGVHFKSFTDPEISRNFLIRAGTSHSAVPIILLRDASLKTTQVTLKFRLVETGDFALGQPSLLWRKLVFTDKLIKPAAWSGSNESQFYGTYSEAKHRFMISATGQKWDQDFMSQLNKGITEPVQYWMSMVKSSLAAYNLANPSRPIIDEITNQPVVFP